MLFGLDGVEIGLIIVFVCLFGGILSGFPVAFAIGGAGVVSFGIIAVLDSAGILVHQAIDTTSQMYGELLASGVKADQISIFRYPDLPRIIEPLFKGGWETALERNISFIVNRINERVLAGQSIEVLLAVLMFVLMGITLERSKIANDLLTTMARVFGPLPGGLAVSVVVVGAFLAASTGIVGATVVTMGLLSLPTMLRSGYSPELSTGVIAASGTLGQIIPPSIVIVLLGTLTGDLYSAAQEARAQSMGCTDALTYLGKPAVVSVGSLFQAALLPGIMLALLYAIYAFGYALLNPSKAPAVTGELMDTKTGTAQQSLTWFVYVPVGIIGASILLNMGGLAGSQSIYVESYSDIGQEASLRTNVSEECQQSMIELHGQEAWDKAIAQQEAIDASGGVAESEKRSDEEIAALVAEKIASAPPIGTGILVLFVLSGIVLSSLLLVADILLIQPDASASLTWALLAVPVILILYSSKTAVSRLADNELLRVVFPPLVLIVAVLGSILGGITNPTPAAALGAAGAIMLAAYRKLKETDRSGKFIINATFALIIMLLVGINFDLRINTEQVSLESWVAFFVAYGAYLTAIIGLIYACWVLYAAGVMTSVVQETSKVTTMVFAILIGSQLLNLVVISFGGEHYIQQFLRSFDSEVTVFLIVMLVLFILGFVLDFLEIIYIVIPIVGPVIYGGTFDPLWVTIMVAINLQTSFLTPPFGFALFYLRGVAPKSVTTGHIYRGVIPFVLIQIIGLTMLYFAPSIVTIVPQLLGGN
ncbi:MAG: TRAP transporter large permease subunit [Rhodobacterales bacterium]|nr:TRAP transporter large permease subunit [Rhodobacterales bacterium]